MNAVPAPVAVRESRTTPGSLLVTRIVTPPCAVAPSRAVTMPCWSPAPRNDGIEKKVMPGAVTVTASGPAARNPVAVAFTAVEPAPIGSNATPPVSTVVGELV